MMYIIARHYLSIDPSNRPKSTIAAASCCWDEEEEELGSGVERLGCIFGELHMFIFWPIPAMDIYLDSPSLLT